MFGTKIGCTYDIGCAFSRTLKNSSLSQKVEEAKFRLMVGTFHGHAHNCHCQLQWHPLYIQGTGHSEGEGCEHVFSSSNDLARSTRHSTRFHRHQSIEEHFNFWDQDKYTNLSMWHFRTISDRTDILQADSSRTITRKLQLPSICCRQNSTPRAQS